MSTIIHFLTRLFFVGAAAGFGLSALAHLLSFLSFSLPTDEVLLVLEVGAVVLFISLIIVKATDSEVRQVQRNRPFLDITGSHAREVMFAMTRHAPDWARTLYYVLFGYTIIIFIIGTGLFSSSPGFTAFSFRPFSAFWMTFYYYMVLVLYSKAREQALKQETTRSGMDTRYQPSSPDDHSKWPR